MKYECRKCVGEDTDSEGNCILDVGITADIPCACPYGQPFVAWKLIHRKGFYGWALSLWSALCRLETNRTIKKEDDETDGEQTVKNSV